ncbi:hypothetical protein JOE63_002586 [Cellulosimicrobium cellulans]|uniref:hypothetical protein n=1 Tax=Cellulosimicrobium cellulans TaxID=1710 RepID=UPI001957ACDE|nr:hypothetical protein [Cellulosimicrobium cellulans]MBM7820109.1 hypothetical protein [Cellulosimicrobium cellulans]
MTTPAFTFAGAPAEDEPTTDTTRPALADGELIAVLGDQEISTRLRPEPSTEKVSRPGQAIAKALEAATRTVEFTPPREAAQAVARTTDNPALAAAQIQGAFRVVTPEGELLSAHYEASTPMLLPGPQPRGMSGTRATDPLWPAPTVQDGIPRYPFASPTESRKVLVNSVERTMRDLQTRNRPAEILATGVRQELSTHLAVFTFDDGAPDQWVILIRDGITRWTASMMLALELAGRRDLKPLDVATQIIDAVLPLSRTARPVRDDAFAVAQHALRTQWLREYTADQLPARGKVAPSLGQRAIHLRQSIVVPTRLYLPTSDDGEMIGAIDRMVQDSHTGQQGWAGTDQSFKQALDIIHSMHRQTELTESELSLLLDVDPHQNSLDRAARIARLLLNEKYEEFKAEIRRQGTYSAVHLHHAVELLAAVISRPWAHAKPIGSAWGYRGLLEPDFQYATLTLASPRSYLELVPAAIAGDEDAIRELRLVGTIALVANGVITTTVVGGSGGAKKPTRRLPLRDVFGGLAATHEGLTQLALAADWFHDETRPEDDPTPGVDLAAPGSAALDPNGHVPGGGVTSPELVDLAAAGLQQGGGEGDDGADDDRDPVTKAVAELLTDVEDLQQSMRTSSELVRAILDARSRAEMEGRDILSQAAWTELSDHFRVIQESIFTFKPKAPAA